MLAPAIAAGAILAGIAGFDPSPTRPWGIIASAMGLLAGATLVWAVLFFRGGDSFPSASDALHLAAALSLVGGLSIFPREASTDTDGPGGIEVAIVGIAIGLGVWLAVVEPYLADGDVALADRIWALLAPLLGALAIALASRLAVQSQFRSPAPTLMLIGVTLLVGRERAADRGGARRQPRPGRSGRVDDHPGIAVHRRRGARSDDDDDEPQHRCRPHLRSGASRLAECCCTHAADRVAHAAVDRARIRHHANARCDLFDCRRCARPHPDVATRCHRAGADRAPRAGPARRHGRTLQRRGVAHGRRRSHPVCQPRAGEHARSPIERLDRTVDDRSGVERRP